MLLTLINDHRSELIARARAKVRTRSSPPVTPDEIENGVPLFLKQFTDLLAATNEASPLTPEIAASAALHGRDMLRRGFTIGQVVHDYGDVCQAITEVAGDLKIAFSTGEFHLLNLCLDNAIAGAVTEYSRLSEQSFRTVAHEMRDMLNTAVVAFGVLSSGSVGISGNTGKVLQRTLAKLVELSLKAG